jgi:GDP-4-dehydro-6-deoxy-D-mannose reductase
MRVLVTGITGFAGRHLAHALLAVEGLELHGLARSITPPEAWERFRNKVVLHSCDMAQAENIQGVIRDIDPQQIYHLAGYAHAGQSFQEGPAAWAGNLTGTLNLLEAVAAWAPRARVLFVGSGLIYGEPDPTEVQQSEQSVLRPASPYAASKAAADLACFQATRAPGLDVVRARPFNHFGPGQSPLYAIAHFAQQIAAIEAGASPPVLETGSLEARRDLTDVRDVVAAYQLLMQKGRKGEAYNIGAGTACTMQSIVDSLCSLARIKVEVRRKENLLRPNDTPIVVADAAKLRQELGWKPAYTLRQSLEDTLTYWREQNPR